MTPAALAAALPPQAAQYLCEYIDPADAFIALAEGLTPAQARSRARNATRSLGSSWPDRLPAHALIDPADLLETQQKCGLHALAPDEILEAIEGAAAALGGADAARRLAQADAGEIDTRKLADILGITQRRAQQIKRARVDLAARQLPLFCEDEEGDL